MTQLLSPLAAKMQQCTQQASKGFVGREPLAELIVLAAVAQEHLLVIGPPGTAKSAVVRRMATLLQGQYFEYLLGRFTEPSELFGAIDLQKLRDGRVETDCRGMLPEADIVFLDEVFLGSTAILNTLLGILNERQFRRGHTQIACPLKVCIGAANGLPEDEGLMAFADRFLLRLFVEPVADELLEDMLVGGWQAEQATLVAQIGMGDLAVLSSQVDKVDLSQVITPLAQAIRLLRQDGLILSDRRIVKTQRLIAAAAVLNGRLVAVEADLWPLLYVLPTITMQQRGREVLSASFGGASHDCLYHAVEAATLQPYSRVQRLLVQGRDGLASATSVAALEALLREIDANFSAETLPEDLRRVRIQLLARLEQ